MTDRSPRVTIGVPVYNGAKYLALALDSILAQTFTDFEVLISDNASADATAKIARRYASRDSRIRFERQATNRGAAWNYNRVMRDCRSPYFKWMAHDDVIGPNYLAACVATLDRSTDVCWCQSLVQLIDADGAVVRGNINAWNNPHTAMTDIHSVQSFDPGGRHGDRSAGEASVRFAAVLLGAAWCLDGYGLMRTSVLQQTRGYLPTYGTEKILVGELSLLGRYAEVPEPLQMIRVHDEASGSLASTAEQQAYMGARSSNRWAHPRLQLLSDQWTAIGRAPLSRGERLRCYAVVARYLLQVGKWRNVLRSFARGSGTGGANRIFIPRTASEEAAAARECASAPV
jgi:hypothetical protein